MGLTRHQIDTLVIIERTTASISVTGTLLLFSTFLLFKEFRTLSNTLIFYASFANVFANVAALIGASATSRTDSSLCQFQAFLLEMFMQSDPLWSLAMAVNVYLVFFRRFDAASLKRLYWIYGLFCYGFPCIPAVVCLLLKKKNKGRVFGDATLWCWIDNEWAPLRIYTYYAPIWVAILLTFAIYIRVGVEVFNKRSQLGEVSGNGDNTTSSRSMSTQLSAPFTGIRTTEVAVTSDAWQTRSITSPRLVHGHPVLNGSKYSITISAREAQAPLPARTRIKSQLNSMDKVKWAYTKVALLFAISILITWVPASVNRVYGLIRPQKPSFPLNVASALVLPLQGFWNTVIYFWTSLNICKSCWARLTSKKESYEPRGLNITHLTPVLPIGVLPGTAERREKQSLVNLKRIRSQRRSMHSFTSIHSEDSY